VKRRVEKTTLVLICLFLFSGCASASADFDPARAIDVVSREDGSGTRGAFVDLFEIVKKSGDGGKKDMTTKEAIIAKQTDVMIMNVTANKYAVGYISIGSLGDNVKAVEVNGVAPTAANVKNGDYSVSRSFLVVTKGAATGLASDFIDFILSSDGQAVVSENYITVGDDSPEYAGDGPSGKIVVAGSSSVTPLMEKLKEAYLALNASAVIEIQQSDSSAGITGTVDGSCDVGMSSRELAEEEREFLDSTQIAVDGIAIIVNKANPTDNLTKEQVKGIFTGEMEHWSDVE
jgi:phosphate transport system substrate-binding protein